MKRGGMFALLAFVLCCTHYAIAQETPLNPLLRHGAQELSLSGFFDFQLEGDPFLEIRVAYGVFRGIIWRSGGRCKLRAISMKPFAMS